MHILCLGNNTEHTDSLTRTLSEKNCQAYYGLLAEVNGMVSDHSRPGYYQTSIFDISYSKLIDIAAHFSQIIILDQSVESYQHADAFYKTVQLANELSDKTDIIWQRPDMATAIDYFEKLVTDNPSFCIFPFIELLTNNGHTTVCCRSSTPITQIENLIDYHSDPAYGKIRDSMIKGIKIPEHCYSCYKLEDIGIRSARQQETVEWANKLGLKSIEDVKNIRHPIYYEVRPSNVCNLQCRMCTPVNSELINKEYASLKIISEPYKIEYSNFDIVNLDHVQKLYVAGGEPLAMPEFYEFLDSCILHKRIFDFTVNTNATKINERFKEQLRQLPHIQFIVSIDGYRELNHYIRWPSKWDTVIDNVEYLIKSGHVVSFNTTVTMYNVAELYNLLEFFDRKFPSVLVHLQKDNGLASPLNFPDPQLVLDDLKKIKNLNCYKNEPLLASFVNGLIHYFEKNYQVDTEQLIRFKNFSDLLDSNRNVKLQDYSAKLARVLPKA